MELNTIGIIWRWVGIGLARDRRPVFIEAAFAQAGAALAAKRAHLTIAAAGGIAHEAGACRVEPFHFSPHYPESEERMLEELTAAFAGRSCEGAGS